MGTIIVIFISVSTLFYTNDTSTANTSVCDCQTEQSVVNDDFSGNVVNDDFSGN